VFLQIDFDCAKHTLGESFLKIFRVGATHRSQLGVDIKPIHPQNLQRGTFGVGLKSKRYNIVSKKRLLITACVHIDESQQLLSTVILLTRFKF